MYPNRKTFLDVAENIASKICTQAFWFGDQCNWIGGYIDEMINQNSAFTNKALSSDIYEGTSGIALFLSNLYRHKKQEKYLVTAEGAINQALLNQSNLKGTRRFGYYSGILGIIHVASRVGTYFKNDRITEQALEMARKLSNTRKEDHLMDIMFGNASAIPTLIDLYEIFHEDFFLELAKYFAYELIDNATREKFGWSWNRIVNGIDTTHNLTGFAHGAAGIGYSLLELYRISNEKKLLNAARLSFLYENHWFNKENNNWPDFRTSTNESSENKDFNYTCAWCHGAPGIGFSRLRAYQIIKDSNCLADASASLNSSINLVRKLNKYSDFSLCHGFSGIGELFIFAHSILRNDSYKSIAYDIGIDGIKNHIDTDEPWPCGIGGGQTPSLMLGLAGIGNFYLRLYDSSIQSPLIIIPARSR